MRERQTRTPKTLIERERLEQNLAARLEQEREQWRRRADTYSESEAHPSPWDAVSRQALKSLRAGSRDGFVRVGGEQVEVAVHFALLGNQTEQWTLDWLMAV